MMMPSTLTGAKDVSFEFFESTDPIHYAKTNQRLKQDQYLSGLLQIQYFLRCHSAIIVYRQRKCDSWKKEWSLKYRL
jgi:hypothetical protein